MSLEKPENPKAIQKKTLENDHQRLRRDSSQKSQNKKNATGAVRDVG
jgi:hypothetical protein